MKSKQIYKRIHHNKHFEIMVSLLAQGRKEEGLAYDCYYVLYEGNKRARTPIIRHCKSYYLTHFRKRKTRSLS